MWTFRPAGIEDCERIAALVNSAYRGETSRRGWTTEADLLDGMRTDAPAVARLLRDGRSVFLLAFDDAKRLCGSVHLQGRSDGTCYLGMLTVKPDLQAAGIGRALLAEAERYARETFSAGRMEMTVITVRSELLAWYERRGYRRTGRTVPFPVDPLFGVLKVPSLEMEILEKPL